MENDIVIGLYLILKMQGQKVKKGKNRQIIKYMKWSADPLFCDSANHGLLFPEKASVHYGIGAFFIE